MRIIEQIPCLAAEELNNNALVPFQIVPPMLSRCLHLYININIMASASHYHDDAIFLSLDDLILISFHSSAHLPPFCLSSSVLAPCWASAPWLTMLRFLSSMVPYNYLLFLPPQQLSTCLYLRAATPTTWRQTRVSLVDLSPRIRSWTFQLGTWSRRGRLTYIEMTRAPSKPKETVMQ